MVVYSLISSLIMAILISIMFFLYIKNIKVIKPLTGCIYCGEIEGFWKQLEEKGQLYTLEENTFICKSCHRDKVLEELTISDRYKKTYNNISKKLYLKADKVLKYTSYAISFLGIPRICISLLSDNSFGYMLTSTFICNVQIILIILMIFTILNTKKYGKAKIKTY